MATDKRLDQVSQLTDFDYALIVKGDQVAKASKQQLAELVGNLLYGATNASSLATVVAGQVMKSEWNLLAEYTGMTSIVEELETAFTSWAEYSMNTFKSQSGAEAGAVIYKHRTNLPSYGIMLSRNIGIVSIWRNSEGTWKYKHILSCNC